MEYSDKELQQIEVMAGLFLTVSDIAIILGRKPEEVRRDVTSVGTPAYNAYTKGKVSRKLELRKQEIQLAQVGSPLALENARLALIDMEDDE